MFEPMDFPKQMYCTEESALTLLGLLGALRRYSAPLTVICQPLVIRRQGIFLPCPPPSLSPSCVRLNSVVHFRTPDILSEI